jgi:Mg-chelatase subunit ChlD
MLPETSTPRFKILALAALVLAAGRPAAGDDRNTVRNSAGNPYVFIILDTSGSMNFSPPCSAADYAAGNCP